MFIHYLLCRKKNHPSTTAKTLQNARKTAAGVLSPVLYFLTFSLSAGHILITFQRYHLHKSARELLFPSKSAVQMLTGMTCFYRGFRLFILPFKKDPFAAAAGRCRRERVFFVLHLDPADRMSAGKCRKHTVFRVFRHPISFYTMEREILFLRRSTSRTVTSTTSPTLTASRGCLMKRLLSLEIWTSPS